MFFPEGLLGEHGPSWHELRSSVQQDMMRPKSAYFYMKPLQEISSDLVSILDQVRNGQGELPDETFDFLNRWALEGISRIFLDTRIGALDGVGLKKGQFADQMVHGGETFFKHLNRIAFAPPFFKVWPKAFAWYR